MKHETDPIVERLCNQISLTRLIQAKGIQLSTVGTDLVGQCPFHDDADKSLVVSPDMNQWCCKGPCQISGSVIEWVMRAEKVSFNHAIELIRTDDPILTTPITKAKQGTIRKLPAMFAAEADDAAVLKAVAGHYQRALQNNPEIHGYLEQRGLKNHELVEQHQLGYSDRSLGYRLPLKNRVEGKRQRERLESLGVFRETGHEHFVGCLTVPIADRHGRIVQIYGRRLGGGNDSGHLCLSGPPRGVWNEMALEHQTEVILCKSILDAMTLWCAGHRNVTACYGHDGFTDDHLQALKTSAARRVYVAYAGTDAGKAATVRLSEKLIAEGFECLAIRFPEGMDANDFALANRPAATAFAALIRNAESLGKPLRPSAPVSEPSAATEAETPPESVPVASADVPEINNESVPAAVQREVEVGAGEVQLSFDDREYRVRGLEKNLAPETLRVNVLATRGGAFHVDTLDLYAARARATFVHQAAVELGVSEDVIKHDLGRLLLKLEMLQGEQIRDVMAPRSREVMLSDADRKTALELLSAPDLLDRIVQDFDSCGVVGERTNKLVGYLACVSRKLSRPLAILIRSNSAAGKTSLLDAILAMTPEEDRVQYSAMTGQSLYYLSGIDLKHKILAIAEEEGASQASYALKLLQSQGALSIASTGKDQKTGRLVAQEYRIEGPVMLAMTSTAVDLDEELLNRCLVLTVDEGRDQTRAIHVHQRRRRTLEGLVCQESGEKLMALHRNAQRLLRPLAVVNPYADRLTFLDDRTRTRRDHEKYLTLIDTIALLHQHQRPIRTFREGDQVVEYLEAELGDIELANQLAHEILGRSLDELPPQTRILLKLIQVWVPEHCRRQGIARSAFRFTRRELREQLGLGDTQLKLHLSRLVGLEYLLLQPQGRGRQYAYELLYDGDQDGGPHLNGLIDVAALKAAAAKGSGSGRPSVGGVAVPGQAGESTPNTDTDRTSPPPSAEGAQEPRPGIRRSRATYTQTEAEKGAH